MLNWAGVRTDYLITSKSDTLSTSEQVLIRRAYAVEEEEALLDYGFGLGVEAIHFEFQTTRKILSVEQPRAQRKNYRMAFFGADDEFLGTLYILGDRDRRAEIGEQNRIYTINFLDKPVLLFRTAKRIDICFID